MLAAFELDQVVRGTEAIDRLLHQLDRRGGVRRAADREERGGDAVRAGLVVAEGRQEGLPGVGHVADRGLDARIAYRLPAGKAERGA